MKGKQSKGNIRIYTDIFSVFDMRLALIKEISEDAVLFEIENGYYDRKSFDTLTLSANAIRGSVTNYLPNIHTDLFKQIIKLLQHIKIKNTNELVESSFSITVNLYPYQISKEEKIVLARMFSGILAMDVEIQLISDEPTIEHTGDFDYLFMYYGLRWLDKYVIKEKHSLITSMLAVPYLSESRHFELNDDIVAELKLGLATYIDLDFIPVKHFSARRNNVS